MINLIQVICEILKKYGTNTVLTGVIIFLGLQLNKERVDKDRRVDELTNRFINERVNDRVYFAKIIKDSNESVYILDSRIDNLILQIVTLQNKIESLEKENADLVYELKGGKG